MAGCLFLCGAFVLTISNGWGFSSFAEMAKEGRSGISQNKISNLFPIPFFPKKGVSETAQKKPLERQGVPARPKYLACSSKGQFLLCSWALENHPFLSYSQRLWQERAQSVSLQMHTLHSNKILLKMMESMTNLQELHLFCLWPDVRPLKNLRKIPIKKLSISYSAVENRVFPIEDCQNFPPSLVSFSWQLPTFETNHQLSHYLFLILKECQFLEYLTFKVGFLSSFVDLSIFRFSKVKKVDLIFSGLDHFSTFGLEDLFQDVSASKQTSLSLSLPTFEKSNQLSNFFWTLFVRYPDLNFLTLKASFNLSPLELDFFRFFKIRRIRFDFEEKNL